MSTSAASPLADDDPRHGRARGYNLGCRCAPCRQARRASDTAYRVAHREERRASSAAYYATHRAEVIAGKVVYRATNHAAIAARRGVYYTANRAKIALYQTAYRATHPDQSREANARRRACKRGNVTIPYSRADIIARDLIEGCYLCGNSFDPANVHLDHIDPIDNGGDDAAYNVAATHPACNLSKGAKTWPVMYVLATVTDP